MLSRAIHDGRKAALVAVAAAGAIAAAAVAPAPVSAGRTVSVGAYISNADNNPALIDDFNAQVDRDAAIIVSYKEWSQAPFVGEQLDGIWNHGAVPLITWEPVGLRLKRIARGSYDGYVEEAARVAANWGKPLMLRFGQEMNGDWFSWGRHPVTFKAAWRHLVRVFRKAGADNVRWVWNPYVNSRSGQLPFTPYFPGDEWVDWVGLDVINWGDPHPWRTFSQIVGRSYDQLVQLTPKPVIVAETGSGERGGSKARWVSRMLRHNIPRMGHVRAIAFWSEEDSRGDLRVDSSGPALAALRSSLGSPLYASSREALLSTSLDRGR